MAATAAIIGAVAAVASAGTGIAASSGAFKGSAPKPAGGGVNVGQQLDPASMQQQLLSGEKANQASRLGGGISPQFIQDSLNQQTGGNVDILSQIRDSLGQGGGGLGI